MGRDFFCIWYFILRAESLHLQLASEAGDMEKVLVAGAAVRTEGKGGGEKVEDKEEK